MLLPLNLEKELALPLIYRRWIIVTIFKEANHILCYFLKMVVGLHIKCWNRWYELVLGCYVSRKSCCIFVHLLVLLYRNGPTPFLSPFITSFEETIALLSVRLCLSVNGEQKALGAHALLAPCSFSSEESLFFIQSSSKHSKTIHYNFTKIYFPWVNLNYESHIHKLITKYTKNKIKNTPILDRGIWTKDGNLF